MKKLTGLVVILAVLILGAYYLMGYQSESAVKDFVQFVNKTDGVSTSLKKYHRGWFTSTAEIELKLLVPERVEKSGGQMVTIPAEEYVFEMPMTIQHGPFIMFEQGMYFGAGYVHSDLKLSDKLEQRFKQLFSDKSDEPVVRLSLSINYLQKIWFSVSVPKFTLYAKNEDGKLVWNGMDMAMTVSSDASRMEGKYDMDGFQISKKDVVADMKGFDIKYKFDVDNNGLMLGKASLEFQGMNVTEGGKPLLEVNDIGLQMKHQVENDLFSTQLNVSIDKIMAQGQTYGPGKLELAIKNLDAEVLGRINKKAKDLRNASPEESRRIVMEIIPELPDLFSKGASLELSTLSFVMPEGTLKGQFKVSLPSSDATKNPFALIQKVQGDGEFSIPARVLESMLTEKIKQAMKDPQTRQLIEQMRQARQQQSADQPAAAMDDNQMIADMVKKQMDQLLQTGIVVKKGDDYMMEFKLENGRLMVNGKPINPAAFR